MFIDAAAGGQNRLRGDNADVDFNGLNRMSDLNFDTGFEADYYLTFGGGDMGGGDYKLFGKFATLPTGGSGVGTFLGGTVKAPTRRARMRSASSTIDNRNVAGQQGVARWLGAGTFTGLEIAIPLAAIGNPGDCIKILAFVNGGSHDFLANQSLGPLVPGTCNLGEPHAVDFRTQPDDQFFGLCDLPTPVRPATRGQVKTLYRYREFAQLHTRIPFWPSAEGFLRRRVSCPCLTAGGTAVSHRSGELARPTGPLPSAWFGERMSAP